MSKLDQFLSNRSTRKPYSEAERAAYAAYFAGDGSVATCHAGGMVSRKVLTETGWEPAPRE